jgi:hypothetical protein
LKELEPGKRIISCISRNGVLSTEKSIKKKGIIIIGIIVKAMLKENM